MRGIWTAISRVLVIAVAAAVGGRTAGQELPPVPGIGIAAVAREAPQRLAQLSTSTGETPVPHEAEKDDLFFVDPAVAPAAWLQQLAMEAPTPTGPVRRTTRGSRQANVGLASVPNM